MMDSLCRRMARPFRSRAKSAQARGDWGTALVEYRRVAFLLGEHGQLLVQIGNIQAEAGLFEEAEQTFKRGTGEPEVRLRALVGLGGLAERRADWHLAVSAWEKVLETMALEEGTDAAAQWPLSPALVIMHQAKCREAAGDRFGAESDFAFALVLDPAVRRSREAVLMRARMMLRSSRAAALQFLKRSRKLYPDDRGITLLLLKTAIDLGQKDEAVTIWMALPAEVARDAAIAEIFSAAGYKSASASS